MLKNNLNVAMDCFTPGCRDCITAWYKPNVVHWSYESSKEFNEKGINFYSAGELSNCQGRED